MKVCKGIILKTTRYSDTQQIICVYSQERGYLSMISPSGIFKRKNNPVHLLQIVEIEFTENERGGLHKLHSVTQLANLTNLYFDIFKMNIILLWGETLNLILHNTAKDDAMFEYITRSVEYLNEANNETANFNLCFLYRLAGVSGFRINTESWQEGFVFCPEDGSFHPADSGIGYISGPNSARAIYRLCTCRTSELADISLNRQARNILLDIIFTFYRIHFHIDFNIKSIQVLREVFA